MKNLFCPECKEEISVWVELTGGCSGHSGDPDDRCYCDEPDIRVRIEHPHGKVARKKVECNCKFAKAKLFYFLDWSIYGMFECEILVTDQKDLERMLFSGETLQDRLNKKYSEFLKNTCAS